MADVPMPRLSDSMEEGTIIRWLKADGDEVRRGEEIVEIETDKANMTYEADDEGVLSIVAGEGDTLAVGEVIARIGERSASDGGGDGDTGAPEAPPAEDAGAEAPPAEDAGESGEAAPREDDGEAAELEPAREDAADGRPQDDRGGADQDRGSAPEAGATSAAEADGDGGAGDEGAGPAGEAQSEAPAGDGGTSAAEGEERLKVSPVARRMAREAGVALDRLTGTGPGGRIVKADVEAAAEGGEAGAAAELQPEPTPAAAAEPEPEATPEAAPEPEPAAESAEAGEAPAPATPAGATAKGETRIQELSRLQQVVARRMAESKATAPDFHLTVDVDMEAAAALRKELGAADPEGATPSFNDFIVKAAALALRDFPRANGAYRDGRFELYSRVNVGVAVAAGDALVVPTIFDADRKSLGEIARDARALAERARSNDITPPQLSGGTFTVSNLGMYAVRRFVAVINPPQAAILSVGAIEPRAVVRDGEVVARVTVELTLACDHRILYGAEAAEFLSRIRERLERPLLLAL